MYWIIREGKVLVKIPELSRALSRHGLEPAWLPVFYNPKMEVNRDLSVAVLQVYLDNLAPRKPVIVVEPLAASGVRALRYAVEVDGVMRVYAGDIDYESCRLIEENVGINSLWDKVSVYCGDANTLINRLKESKIPALFIDLDPYGSPLPFLNSALSLVGNGGVIAATATDTAVLEGSKKNAALKKYGVRINRIPQSREVAIRVLLGTMAKVAAIYDKTIEPLLSLWIDYYVRVFVRVEKSARRAVKTLNENIGYLYYCKDTGYASFAESLMKNCSNIEIMGPLWIKNLGSQIFIDKLEEALTEKFTYLRNFSRLLKILKLFRGELEIQEYPAQRIDAIASSLKKNVPPRNEVLSRLIGMGFKASLTHFDPLAIRTDAGMKELLSVI